MPSLARIGALGCAMALSAGCGEPAPGDRAASRAPRATEQGAGDTSTADGSRIEVVVRDFAFVAPERMAAGPVTLDLLNAGTVAHQATVLAVGRHGALEAFLSAVRAGRPLPPSARAVGETPRTPPGARSSTRLALAPGDYVIVCLLRDGEGTSHVVRGLIRPLTVTATSAAGEANEIIGVRVK